MRNDNVQKAGLVIALLGAAVLVQPNASAQPVILQDAVMDRVTAGQPENGGGVIVGNTTDSTVTTRSGLSLNDEAQSGASGLNLVNSTESAAANAVNIWQGNTVTFGMQDVDSQPVLEVNQVNQVSQQQLQAATLSGYSRSEADITEVILHSESESFQHDLVNVDQVIDRMDEVRLLENSSEAMVDTELILELDDRLYIKGHLGQGVASSGQVKAVYDGGEAEFALGINGGISASAGISISNDFLGSSADLSAEASAEVGLSLLTTIELPRMEIELSGAGCGVILGSCAASGTSSELVITSSDNSTLEIFDNHQSGESAYTDEYTRIYRSPFSLDHARADYIVIDDSSLQLDSEISLELSESAQKDIEALNLVNAISSNVANTTNISRASQFETVRSSLILNQFNVIRHGQ